MTEQVGAWVRVSTADQQEANQGPDIERYCAAHGYRIAVRYELNDKSAYHGAQDATLARMLADLRAGTITAVVCWHSDRLERRGVEALFKLLREVREAGGRIESVQEPMLGSDEVSGEAMTALSAIMSHAESAKKSERVRIAFDAIEASGGVVGRANYGYRVVGEKYSKQLVKHSIESAILREAATRYLAGETIDAICTDLDARQIASPTFKGQPGKHWYPKTLAGLLRSTSTAGRRVDKSGRTVHKFDGIISWDEHLRLVARLDSRANRAGISPGNVALLTSVLFDALDHPMYRIRSWTGFSYYCRKCHARINLADADEYVSTLFAGWLGSQPHEVRQLVPGQKSRGLGSIVASWMTWPTLTTKITRGLPQRFADWPVCRASRTISSRSLPARH
jgi:DNA invertase Pin-like site-specific DNA recombinase